MTASSIGRCACVRASNLLELEPYSRGTCVSIPALPARSTQHAARSTQHAARLQTLAPPRRVLSVLPIACEHGDALPRLAGTGLCGAVRVGRRAVAADAGTDTASPRRTGAAADDRSAQRPRGRRRLVRGLRRVAL